MKELRKCIPDQAWVAGVFGGFGEFLGISPLWFRFGFLIAFGFFPAMVLWYIVLAHLIPAHREDETLDALRKEIQKLSDRK